MRTEVETGVILSQAKEAWSTKTHKRQDRILLINFKRRVALPTLTLDLLFWATRSVVICCSGPSTPHRAFQSQGTQPCVCPPPAPGLGVCAGLVTGKGWPGLQRTRGAPSPALPSCAQESCLPVPVGSRSRGGQDTLQTPRRLRGAGL